MRDKKCGTKKCIRKNRRWKIVGRKTVLRRVETKRGPWTKLKELSKGVEKFSNKKYLDLREIAQEILLFNNTFISKEGTNTSVRYIIV